MKISRLECFRVPPRWLFVRVESGDGAVGWGEASFEGPAEAVSGVFASLRDRLVGADPFRIEDAWQIAYRGDSTAAEQSSCPHFPALIKRSGI